jgi:membrane protease YdiL (CAAX protease family)
MALQAAAAPGGGGGGPAGVVPELVFSVGAGIYEELLFRLIAIGVIRLVLRRVMELSELAAVLWAVGGSSVAFAHYHFSGSSPFELGRFSQYFVAGLYLAAIYLTRGFGIAVGTHAFYDIIVTLLNARR